MENGKLLEWSSTIDHTIVTDTTVAITHMSIVWDAFVDLCMKKDNLWEDVGLRASDTLEDALHFIANPLDENTECLSRKG